MSQSDLDAELADAMDHVDDMEKQVKDKRAALGGLRSQLSEARSKVEEIQNEIRALVRTGRSSRPLLDGVPDLDQTEQPPTPPAPAKRKPRKLVESGAQL